MIKNLQLEMHRTIGQDWNQLISGDLGHLSQPIGINGVLWFLCV